MFVVRSVIAPAKRTGTWHQQPNASEKIDSFPGRLLFFATFLLFLCVLFGGIRIFRIFAIGKGFDTIAYPDPIIPK